MMKDLLIKLYRWTKLLQKVFNYFIKLKKLLFLLNVILLNLKEMKNDI
jgi:hypothetical protein